MTEIIQLNIVGVEGKRNVTCTLKQLYDEVRRKCKLSLSDDEDLRLVYAGIELENTENIKIKNLEIPNNAQIFMVVRVRGGEENEKIDKKDGRNRAITIESSRRLSHLFASNVLLILVKEILNYEHVEIDVVDEFSPLLFRNALGRLRNDNNNNNNNNNNIINNNINNINNNNNKIISNGDNDLSGNDQICALQRSWWA
ncbi:hypothetical protein HELRODRAFT_181583 [Helobdella robusta]|uniref:Ubiquitin-like domain-containing protein n=1 Tax=Helobdella robusta TaxID=6412 RepID=T1FH48_HELRO|nr:hypothetical protein HELRODRAFT_181583 [Helobdella robusta]ESN92247.1 hypothetical protein HELRODRAFT_181583 [Helobdella robusta]